LKLEESSRNSNAFEAKIRMEISCLTYENPCLQKEWTGCLNTLVTRI
jgi:hypothetical protein